MVDTPFNSLGQILASGGERAIALAMVRGYSAVEVGALVDRRFEPMLPEDRESLLRLADDSIQAGLRVSGLGGTEYVLSANLPFNSQLLGEDGGGTRLFVFGEFSIDEGQSWYQLGYASPDDLTYQELIDQMQRQGAGYVNKTPLDFNADADVIADNVEIRILFAERKF